LAEEGALFIMRGEGRGTDSVSVAELGTDVDAPGAGVAETGKVEEREGTEGAEEDDEKMGRYAAEGAGAVIARG